MLKLRAGINMVHVPFRGGGPATQAVLAGRSAAGAGGHRRRARIEPFAWVINGSFAGADPSNPMLRARAAAEIPLIHSVQLQLAKRVALVAFQAEEPVGVERLNALAMVASSRSQPQVHRIGARP